MLAGAARAVARVVQGESADAALSETAQRQDASAVRAIALGTLRWYLRLAPALEPLLRSPGRLAPEVHALLVCAAHQVVYSRTAPELSVHAAVDATRVLEAARASALVNAVLRRFVAERHSLLRRPDSSLAGRSAHPRWLVEALLAAYPAELAAAILEGANQHPPMVLRVDLTRGSREAVLAELAGAGHSGRAVRWASAAVVLDEPVSVAALPSFAAGRVSVQDAGAQLAVPLLAVAPGMRVLDACAAPGGKTGHLLEALEGQVEVQAVDVDAARAARIEDNLRRLRRAARVTVADVSRPDSFWDGRPFDRILLDAPCSATGVIRRHPDIKLLRRAGDIGALACRQLEIARAAARMLAPGGRMVYATCSVLPSENAGVVSALLESEPGLSLAAEPHGIELPPALWRPACGLQLLPGTEAGTDGFYYACLEKTTSGNAQRI